MYIQHRKKKGGKTFHLATSQPRSQPATKAAKITPRGCGWCNGAFEAPIKMRQVQVMRQKKELWRETKKCLTAAEKLVVLRRNPIPNRRDGANNPGIIMRYLLTSTGARGISEPSTVVGVWSWTLVEFCCFDLRKAPDPLLDFGGF